MNIAITSRFMNIDLPYMSIWFEYYIALGVKHFYLYYVDNIFFELENILNYFPKEKVSIQNIKLDSIQDSNSVFFDYPFVIKEEYILHIDSDEYLYLNNENLYTFLEKNKNVDAFYFYWYMCPSNELIINNFNQILQNKSSKKYIIHTYKILAKNKNIQFIKGYTHDVTFLNNRNVIKKYMDTPYFLIHFSYRGIQDCYYKYIYQNLINHKDVHLHLAKFKICDKNIQTIRVNELPSRVLVFLGELNNKNNDFQINITLPITQKSQYELYDLIDKEENNKNTKLLFINRLQKIIQLQKDNKLQICQNIILPNGSIKNYIKNILLNNYSIITFT